MVSKSVVCCILVFDSKFQVPSRSTGDNFNPFTNDRETVLGEAEVIRETTVSSFLLRRTSKSPRVANIPLPSVEVVLLYKDQNRPTSLICFLWGTPIFHFGDGYVVLPGGY